MTLKKTVNTKDPDGNTMHAGYIRFRMDSGQRRNNTLAIRVYDGQGSGGIYEGPVGIMSTENYREYGTSIIQTSPSGILYSINLCIENDWEG